MSSVLSLNASYYEALKRLTLELAGVNLGSNHAFLVETRLSALARKEGFETLDALVDELFKTGHPKLAIQVVSALLERDTRFNNDPQSFTRFTDEVLPNLYRVRGGGHIRVLSFGCASGQEAYGIAMAFERARDQYPNLSLDIMGVDYPSTALDRAKSGRYTHFEVQRGLATRDLIDFFNPAPEAQSTDWIIRDRLKQYVRFEDVHLLSNLGTLPKFHAVLFRGSLPHYSATAQLRVLRGLASLVLPHGYLLLGTNETLNNFNFGFDTVGEGPGLYQKREEIVEDIEPIEDPNIKKPNGRKTFLSTSPQKSA
ncbi:chemotaxis protein methyltransferase CheR [Litorimonas taeanensis]|uniref:protein-glutamate O-methyltransferase n=1 Tax=Litorimonas taeanensis TaxID=568099 RepID=A0A420WDR7_9PROT|nr:CheR family methyltransferase [Litorimonas taeanensis]RKQ69060.1 chemotaxis protein methyltransferase CheR [Litorimonas taeanensis]